MDDTMSEPMSSRNCKAGVPARPRAVLLLCALGLLCLMGMSYATQSFTSTSPINAPRPADPIFFAKGTANFNIIASLSNNSGSVLLPGSANPSDLPNETWVCPGTTFNITGTDQTNWNPGELEIQYPIRTVRECPIVMLGLPGDCYNTTINAWNPIAANMPVFWLDLTTAEQIYRYGYSRISPRIIQSVSPALFAQALTNANDNANYYPFPNYVGGYLNQKADTGITAYGQMRALVDNAPMAYQPLNTGLTKSWTTSAVSALGIHSISLQTQVQNMSVVVHLMPDNTSNTSQNMKNIHAQPGTVSSSVFSYTVHSVDTTNCSGTLVSIDASQFANLIPGQAITITISVANNHTDMPVIPSSVSASGSWLAVPGPSPNGFNVSILPNTQSNLTVLLTAPDPLDSDNVTLYVNFTDPCSASHMCPANISINMQDDLVSTVIVDKPVLALNEIATITAITWNNGSRPVPVPTNTSVSISGQPTKYFTVRQYLPWTTLDANGLPLSPYESDSSPHTYQFACIFPSTVSVVVNSNFDRQLPSERNWDNNRASTVVVCGTVLGCYDYM